MWSLLVASLLLISYLQLTAGKECIALSVEQVDSLRKNKVTEMVTTKVQGATFVTMWADKGFTDHLKCHQEEFEIIDDVLTKSGNGEFKNSQDEKIRTKHHHGGKHKLEMAEVECGVFEVKNHGNIIEKEVWLHASENVLAFIGCDVDENKETGHHERPPPIRPFISLRKGKSPEDPDVKDELKEAKTKMESLGIEEAKNMHPLTEKCLM